MTSLSPVCNPFLSFDRPVMETLDLILNLTKQKGFCWARNKSLAEQLGVTEVTISRRVSKLIKAGLLFRERVGKKEWHIFPAFPVPADCKKPSEAIEQMIRQRYAKSKPTLKTHGGAANLQTKETEETCGENKQQTAATPESSPVLASPVVASSAKAFREVASPEVKQNAAGLSPIAALLPPLPKPPAESAEQSRGESPGVDTRHPTPEAADRRSAGPLLVSPGVKPDSAAPVADLEIMNALHRRAGMGLRAAQEWAAKQPAECLRLLSEVAQVSGVRNKAAWIVTALREAEEGKPYAFILPPEPKAPPKAAQEGEVERREQKRRADADAVEKAAQAQYEAILEPERERLEAQAVAELPDFMRRKWEAGKYAAKQSVRAAVVTRWRQQSAGG